MDNVPQISLATLFAEAPVKILSGVPDDTSISGIVMDNRLVRPGYLFVAMPGSSQDGHTFIPDAIRAGAAALVGEKRLDGLAVPYIQVENSRQALTWLAAAYYGYPARKMTIIGVTGTDGKTTTCNLLYQILLAAGIRAGLISTVNAVIGDEILDTGFHVTTPDAPDVQRYLAQMLAAGLTHAVLETTSHGWAQHRVDACEFDIGVITNITHEHLDQHGSYENYRSAKARLFQSLEITLPKPQGNPRLSILNRDDSSFEFLASVVQSSIKNQKSKITLVGYGLDSAADIHADSIKYSPYGIHFTVVGPGYSLPLTSPLVGAFNVSNCLAAFTAAVHGLGIDPAIAARGIAALPGVPGRMERIELGQPFTAIVDFAHTPNALDVALKTARNMLSPSPERDWPGMESGRIIVIFGSAGLRDREKRRMMAEVGARLADISILTAEDPRTESLAAILEQMAVGARSQAALEDETFYRVPDRGAAIRLGVSLARPGDILLACGKGHEQSMCFGTTEYLWDDRIAMRAAISELLDLPGPQMPYLPTQE